MLQVPQSHFNVNLSFDDVLLIPDYSDILPKDVDTSSYFSKNIKLKIPLVSAAMDTVTEYRTAIALAQCGGIGVIHKNLSIEDQAFEVAKVKRSESGMIDSPICVSPDTSIFEVKKLMKEHEISGLPVISSNSLVGIVTGRDIAFAEDLNKSVKSVMTREVITAELGITNNQAKQILYKHRIEKLPVIKPDSTKTLVGMFTLKDIEKAEKYPFSSRDSQGRLRVAAAVGVSKDTLRRASMLIENGCDAIVVDTAHGHSKSVMDTCKLIKKNLDTDKFDLIAGNVATSDGALALIECNIDGIKVGMGPGSICTTRVIAGVGMPQFSAIIDVAQVCHSKKVPLIADGGIKFSGDAVKALGAGASTVMIGSMFAGSDEAPGEMVLYQGKTYKTYRGMGSIGAMAKGSKDRYFQQDINLVHKYVPEGIEGRVAYIGAIEKTIYQLVGGIKSGMGYVGAQTINKLQKKAKFVRISQAGLKESHPHGVYITREAPNYYTESR